ncbi:transposase [Pedobacter cryoconitis]|nr:transposase [Pedobacter cryoconitis]
MIYVEAVESQHKEDLIRACENALHYFGGIPQAIVPDNLRSAVTVVAARVYKPRDKSLVEGAVKLIYRSIYSRLEERKFNDLSASVAEGCDSSPFSFSGWNEFLTFRPEIFSFFLQNFQLFRGEIALAFDSI